MNSLFALMKRDLVRYTKPMLIISGIIILVFSLLFSSTMEREIFLLYRSHVYLYDGNGAGPIKHFSGFNIDVETKVPGIIHHKQLSYQNDSLEDKEIENRKIFSEFPEQGRLLVKVDGVSYTFEEVRAVCFSYSEAHSSSLVSTTYVYQYKGATSGLNISTFYGRSGMYDDVERIDFADFMTLVMVKSIFSILLALFFITAIVFIYTNMKSGGRRNLFIKSLPISDLLVCIHRWVFSFLYPFIFAFITIGGVFIVRALFFMEYANVPLFLNLFDFPIINYPLFFLMLSGLFFFLSAFLKKGTYFAAASGGLSILIHLGASIVYSRVVNSMMIGSEFKRALLNPPPRDPFAGDLVRNLCSPDWRGLYSFFTGDHIGWWGLAAAVSGLFFFLGYKFYSQKELT